MFRPGAGWAKALVLLGGGVLAFNFALRVRGFLVDDAVRMGTDAVLESLLQTAIVCVAYLWTAWESLRYHGLMQRRVQIGLADPAVANRFLLWGSMALVTSAGILINSVAIARGIDPMSSPAVLLGSSATGFCQAVLLWLALLPPRTYLDRLRSGAGPGAAPQRAEIG